MSPPGQGQGRPGPAYPAPLNIPNQPSRNPSPGNAPPSPYGQHPSAFPPQEGPRSPYPPGQGPPSGGPPQGRPQHPDARGPPPPGYRPGPGPRPGTNASERSIGASHRKPLPDRTGPAPYGGAGPVDTDDILDSYGDDPGPARQHPYRGPPNDRAGAGPPPGAQGSYGPYGGDASGPERQRAGVLKTVGGNEGPPQPQDRMDIPEINFGPTINYGAPPRKPAPGGPPMPPHAQAQRPYSPAGQRPHDAPPRSPRLPDHEEQRSMPWKPAGMSPGAGQHGVSPEQYVQQRAAASPQYPHVRSPSGEAMAEAQAARPQHARRRSSFSMLHDGRARSNENVHRPSTSQGEGGAHMSARDQEHMARMTGQPLLNVGGGQRPSPGGQPGLVGHIDARERERQQMRQGANQQAAQQAMATRQQQQAAMHQQMMMAERNMSPMPSPGYGPPQSFSRPMASPSPSQSDPRYMPPQGPYQQGPPSGAHPHYQGQAF